MYEAIIDSFGIINSSDLLILCSAGSSSWFLSHIYRLIFPNYLYHPTYSSSVSMNEKRRPWLVEGPPACSFLGTRLGTGVMLRQVCIKREPVFRTDRRNWRLTFHLRCKLLLIIREEELHLHGKQINTKIYFKRNRSRTRELRRLQEELTQGLFSGSLVIPGESSSTLFTEFRLNTYSYTGGFEGKEPFVSVSP